MKHFSCTHTHTRTCYLKSNNKGGTILLRRVCECASVRVCGEAIQAYESGGDKRQGHTFPSAQRRFPWQPFRCRQLRHTHKH